MSYTLNDAAKAAGKSKTTIHRAVKSGKISASKTASGAYSIEPAELHRVFPAVENYRSKEHTKRDGMERDGSSDGTLQTQLSNIEKERERERVQLQEVIADLREDRDRWRQQATGLLEGHKKKSFWKRFLG